MTTGQDILAMDDRRMESVTVPEWDDARVFVRVMGATERAKYEASLMKLKDAPKDETLLRIKTTLVLLCSCNESGVRLFNDNQYDQLAEKNGNAIDRIYEVVDRLNLVTHKAVSDEAGNLKPDGGSDSISD